MSNFPLHEHCETCIKVSKCSVSVCPPFSCEIVSCDLACGARFHQCKLEEHIELCTKEKVPCINSENGCPAVLQRQHLGSHLRACPASVVQCTMEWNRWPVYCQERQARVPFTLNQRCARYSQLDVALALRDQRMLNKSMKVPVKMRRALRNGLTKRFPAVPIVHTQRSPGPDSPNEACSNNTSCTVSDDDSDAPWQRWRNPPGLQSSVCNELFKATKKTTDMLTAALNLVTTSESIQAIADKKTSIMLHQNNSQPGVNTVTESQTLNVSAISSEGSLHYDNNDKYAEGYKQNINCESVSVTQPQLSGLAVDTTEVVHANGDIGVNNLPLEYKEINACGNVLSNTGNVTCDKGSPGIPAEMMENTPSGKGVHVECSVNHDNIPNQSLTTSGEKPSSNSRKIPAIDNKADVITADETLSISLSPGDDDLIFDHTEIGMGSNICNPNRSVPVPPSGPPPDNLRLMEVLGLDINVEWIAPYQHKPKSMYTFLCAQVFRREEFAWHFQNMHGDIMSNLNGWLEQRCPLASQGCTFSMRRLEPAEKGAEIVYNTTVEAFGIKPHIPRSLLSHRESVEKDYLEYLWKTRGTKEATPEIFASKDFSAFVKVHGNLNRQIEKNTVTDDSVNNTRLDLLTGLPVEILQHIGRFLDGFSLCNLALTSRLLREVCCSLLEEKGLVTQEWERQKVDGKVHWSIAYQRWMFSTGFHPIRKLAFADNPHISEHIKQCPFFMKTEAREAPVNVMLSDHTDLKSFTDTMQRMYPNFQVNS